jgi:hypothetical protein
MIEPSDSYDPRNFDILLTDIVAEDIYENIPKQLNVEYLSDAPNELDQNITGIMFGRNFRLFCATTVSVKNKIKMVIFLVDTGSPNTFISEDALRSFGIVLPKSKHIYVSINKRETRVMMSHSHFSDICVIGMDFLNANKVGLFAYCGDDIFFLKFNERLAMHELIEDKVEAEDTEGNFFNLMLGLINYHKIFNRYFF